MRELSGSGKFEIARQWKSNRRIQRHAMDWLRRLGAGGPGRGNLRVWKIVLSRAWRMESAATVSGIKRASDAEAGCVQDMGVDPGGGDILVAREFLDAADVVVVFEEVGGEKWRRVWQDAALVMPAA